jgi:hypothetical protein
MKAIQRTTGQDPEVIEDAELARRSLGSDQALNRVEGSPTRRGYQEESSCQ